MTTPAITLTGTLQNVFGAPDVGACILINLCNYGTSMPRIPGVMDLTEGGAKIAVNAEGQFSTPIWGNDAITPPGTYYSIAVVDSNGSTTQASNYQLNGSGTFDLSELVPFDGEGTNQPIPYGDLQTATLTLGSATAASVPQSCIGISTEKANAGPGQMLVTSGDQSLVNVFKTLGPGVLRIGGNSIDSTVWTPGGSGTATRQFAPSNVAALASFLAATGWKCIYGINLGGSDPDWPYQTSAALAAAEAIAAAEALGSSLLAFEIGNEANAWGVAGQPYAGETWNLSTYESIWLEYYAAIRAAVPGCPVNAPDTAFNSSSAVTGWTAPFLAAVTAAPNNAQLAAAEQHHGLGATTAAEVLSLPAQSWNTEPNRFSTIISQLAAAAAAVGIPWRFSESVCAQATQPVAGTYASALWAIDSLFMVAAAGGQGSNFIGLGYPDNTGTEPDYSPIAVTYGPGYAVLPVTAVNPVAYGMKFFSMIGPGTIYELDLGAGSLNVNAYAVKNPNGVMKIVIVNKELTTPLDLEITLAKTVASASLLELTQGTEGFPDVSATSGVTIQGATITTAGNFAPNAAYVLTPNANQLTCYAPALSAVLIQVQFT